MVVITTELQVSWWKPWTRRIQMVTGRNYEEAMANMKKEYATLPNFNFINRIQVCSVNQ